MSFGPESLEVQQVLAHVLRKPSLSSQDIVTNLFPGRQDNEIKNILIFVKNIIGKQLKAELSGLPDLTNRLRFCWISLRQLENTIRKTKGEDIPSTLTLSDLRNFLKGVFPLESVHDCLVQELCGLLHLEATGDFLKHYSSYLKAKRPKAINLSIIDIYEIVGTKNLRRVICWIVRKNKYRYVEINDDASIKIHFPYLINYVRDELKKSFSSSDINKIQNLTEEIENEVNSWLAYSCLDGDCLPTEPSIRRDIVSWFIKANNLDNKIVVYSSPQQAEKDKRILELESEISGYAEENRRLEKENRDLQDQLSASYKIQEEIVPEPKILTTLDFQDLLEFLKIIDSKYSFDILRSVQIGDEQSISIKTFLAHFFYSLRKKGLTTYPTDEQFDLHYDLSGLYQCNGFEIAPSTACTVKVEKYGWALKKDGRILPIKKAIVRLVE